jgi:hypothetical protein
MTDLRVLCGPEWSIYVADRWPHVSYRWRDCTVWFNTRTMELRWRAMGDTGREIELHRAHIYHYDLRFYRIIADIASIMGFEVPKC